MSTTVTVLPRVLDGHTYAGVTDLQGMVCPECGITYAIPYAMQKAAHEAGNRKITWYCPNGHCLGYSAPGVDQKRAQKAEADAKFYRERFEAERDLHDHTTNRLRAQKAATTKAKKRHAAGVCPCCNRTFQQLQRHMANKHPDFDPAREGEGGG